jgi:hypothetical protein
MQIDVENARFQAGKPVVGPAPVIRRTFGADLGTNVAGVAGAPKPVARQVSFLHEGFARAFWRPGLSSGSVPHES